MRSTGNDFLHYFLYFGQLVHQIQFIMQTTCRIDNYHIGIIRLRRTQRIERHGCRIGSHFLFHDRDSNPFAPYHQLLDRSGTKRIGSSQINTIPSLFILICQLTDSCSLTYTIHPDNHDYIRFFPIGDRKFTGILNIVFG